MAQTFDKAHGTQSATVGTEHTLDTESAAGIFTVTVDLTNMVSGDTVIIRAYEKALTGGTDKLLYTSPMYQGVQGDAAAPGSKAVGEVLVQSDPVVSAFECVFTLHQVAGTSRNFDWRVDQLA
jgi:hypothetical protein